MSNYDFLIEKSENVEKYPFLKVLYGECTLAENLSFINESLMYNKCCFILEEVIDYYSKLKNIDKNQASKKKVINKVETILLRREFGVNKKEKYHIISNLYNDELIDNWTLDKNSKTYRTLSNLRSFILWFYNELCIENVEDNGLETDDINIMSILDIKCLNASEDLVNYKEDILAANESKIKKLIKKTPLYDFVFNEDSTVIINKNKEAVFEIFKVKDNLTIKNNDYYINVLSQVKNEIDYLKAEFKTVQKDMLKYQERNIQAVESFENYCDVFNVEDRKKAYLLDKVEEVRKEENKILSYTIDEIEKSIMDKSDTLKFLNKSLMDNGSFNVYYKIDELNAYVKIIKNIFQNLDLSKEYDFLCEKVKRINNAYEKTDFNKENKNTNFSLEELKNLFCILKARYNELIFKYESERIVSDKIERDSKEYEQDTTELKKSLDNKNKEISDSKKRLEEVLRKNAKLKKCYGGIVVIFVLIILLLVVKDFI